jgi:hypothetical protein
MKLLFLSKTKSSPSQQQSSNVMKEVIVYHCEEHKKHKRALYRQTEESFNVKAPAFMQQANIILFYRLKL